MEMNQSNRINAQNSWNLKLIDYLQEVMSNSLSQNQNFQVAGVTIECSVKIYSSRVDSLETESLRVVGTLHRSDGKSNQATTDEPAAEEAQRTRRTQHTSTLEANPENLDVRNVEAQFDVDPLFRITCSKFDAGGASGLLLNNIRLGTHCQLLLDSSIAPPGETSDEELWGGLSRKDPAADGADAGVDDDIRDADMQEAPDGPEAPVNDAPAETIARPAGDAGPDTTVLPGPPAEADAGAVMAIDDDDGDGFDGPDFGDGPDEFDGEATPPLTSTDGPEGPTDAVVPAEGPAGEDGPLGEEESPVLVPAPDIEAEILQKQANDIVELIDGGNEFTYFNAAAAPPPAEEKTGEEDDASDCFDSEIENMAPQQNTGWTGMAGHWKFRVSRSQDDAKPQPKPEAKRKGRDTQRLDFSAALTEVQLKAFEPPHDPCSTLLAWGKERARALAGKLPRDKALRILEVLRKGADPATMLLRAKRKGLYLPDDNHFDLESLFQPFTRPGPEWNLKARALRRRRETGPDAFGAPRRSTEAPGAPAAGGAPQPDVLPDMDMDIDPDPGGANDYGDDGPDDPDDSLDVADALLAGPEPPAVGRLSGFTDFGADPPPHPELPVGAGLVDLVQAPELVNAVKVNYSKVAKQIDIKRLKDCMWARISAALRSNQSGESESEDATAGGLKFTTLIADMEPDVRLLGNPADITISFYFISLLHLANERGLQLRGLPSLTDLLILPA